MKTFCSETMHVWCIALMAIAYEQSQVMSFVPQMTHISSRGNCNNNNSNNNHPITGERSPTLDSITIRSDSITIRSDKAIKMIDQNREAIGALEKMDDDMQDNFDEMIELLSAIRDVTNSLAARQQENTFNDPPPLVETPQGNDSIIEQSTYSSMDDTFAPVALEDSAQLEDNDISRMMMMTEQQPTTATFNIERQDRMFEELVVGFERLRSDVQNRDGEKVKLLLEIAAAINELAVLREKIAKRRSSSSSSCYYGGSNEQVIVATAASSSTSKYLDSLSRRSLIISSGTTGASQEPTVQYDKTEEQLLASTPNAVVAQSFHQKTLSPTDNSGRKPIDVSLSFPAFGLFTVLVYGVMCAYAFVTP